MISCCSEVNYKDLFHFFSQIHIYSKGCELQLEVT